jgi:hypothetical protein
MRFQGRLLELIVEIEDRTGITVPLPEKLSPGDVDDVTRVAKVLRTGRGRFGSGSIQMTVPRGLVEVGTAVGTPPPVRQEMTITVLGVTVPVGPVVMQGPSMVVASIDELEPPSTDQVCVRLEPATGAVDGTFRLVHTPGGETGPPAAPGLSRDQ